jgi:hypothetical protein
VPTKIDRIAAVLAALAAAACVAPPAPETAAFVATRVEEPPPPHPSEVPCSARRVDEAGVAVAILDCPLLEVSSAQGARTRLAADLGVATLPGPPRRQTIGIYRSYFEFVVDTGERPLRTRPVFPDDLARSGDAATCVARLDLTPDGRTTNICVVCAATRARGEFEAVARATVEGWLYPTVASGAWSVPRRGVWEGLRFDPPPGAPRGSTPAAPRTACGARVPPETGRA